jgi:hypothetical protein
MRLCPAGGGCHGTRTVSTNVPQRTPMWESMGRLRGGAVHALARRTCTQYPLCTERPSGACHPQNTALGAAVTPLRRQSATGPLTCACEVLLLSCCAPLTGERGAASSRPCWCQPYLSIDGSAAQQQEPPCLYCLLRRSTLGHSFPSFHTSCCRVRQAGSWVQLYGSSSTTLVVDFRGPILY